MRASGILMGISSLPGSYGIGTMGKEAYEFVDFLEQAGQRYWQILPVGPTSYGDSPYQSFSTYAGNPYFIDPELLEQDGLLQKEEYEDLDWGSDPAHVDYGKLYVNRYPLLRKAFARFNRDLPEFCTFEQEQADWLHAYALFMALKNDNEGKSWQEWEKPLKTRDPETIVQKETELAEDMAFWSFLQFEFQKQWKALKTYANEKKIQIIGDLPIYVALDSADVWMHPEEFELDENCEPLRVAGCPPDAFSADGQLWGNPLYRWEQMKQEHYCWWISRIRRAATIYDVIRIDHFRGFDSYYAIPYGASTAKEGCWEKGPGMDLFHQISQDCGALPIIAEDLGILTDSVRELLKESGYPGMKVLEFAFDEWRQDNEYQPHHYIPNCVAYTGTHDNMPLAEWWESISPNLQEYVMEYFDVKEKDTVFRTMIRRMMASSADTVLIPIQDYLETGHGTRMNTPATCGENWQYRCQTGECSPELAVQIRDMVRLYQR